MGRGASRGQVTAAVTPVEDPNRYLRPTARGRIAMRGALLLAVVVPLIFSVTGFIVYPSGAQNHHLAVELADSGTHTQASSAQIREYRKDAQVRVTFDVGGRAVTEELVGQSAYLAGVSGQQWQPLTSESGYELPLAIVDLASDASQVMALKDVPDWADPELLTTDLVIGIVGAVPLLIAVVVWFARGRPAWWLYLFKIGEPCWYCAHPKKAHDANGHCQTITREGPCPCSSYVLGKPRKPTSGAT